MKKYPCKNGKNFYGNDQGTLCSKAKIRMFINEIKSFHFEKRYYNLPMTCQSVVEKLTMEYLNKHQLFSPVKLDTYGRLL